ncbi:MAG TPA: hypothetical protein VMU15_20645 [Anaeromyxobacter sp.]|nr:hypothetical protein [Anaeromyxobacter sp.]
MRPCEQPGAPPAGPATGGRALAVRIGCWLLPFAALGAALVHFYPDSYQQDGGFHFLFARWALAHPRFLLGVWARPLFTALYALPAQLGYPAAKLATVAVALATAWHTARLARAHGLERAELAVPLLFLEPSFLLVCSETMTEPLFALLLVVALRLHRAGRVAGGMWVASLLPLARPEGFFLCLLWGAFVALDRHGGGTLFRRALSTARLLGGVALWWLAALLMTHDPLFIVHNWPQGWSLDAGPATGSLAQYWRVRYLLLAGPAMLVLFGVGLVALWVRRRLGLAVASLGLLVALHSVFFRFGLFGSAGYARYLVCVAPPMALATLAGWNALAEALPGRLARRVGAAVGAAVLLRAAWLCLGYVDSYGSSRDARAVADTAAWFRAHPRPVARLVYSQAYMDVLLDVDLSERPVLGRDRERNVEILRALPPGTLVFWDALTGPQFHDVRPADLERAGYQRLYRKPYLLEPLLPFLHRPPLPEHRQEMYLYYKG